MASSLSRISALHNHISPLEANNNKKLRSLVKIISPQVSEAISNGRAVVALESTIISHGMPYPQNLQTAKEVESIVRENGAVPATIAILYGVPCIGLSEEELERYTTCCESLYICSPHFCQRRLVSCSSTYHVHCFTSGGNKSKWCNYSLCNVVFRFSGWHPSFCNRGIGGVHRHADHTMDISSDLTALGRTPIAVISAGVKSILHIPKTLEYLWKRKKCMLLHTRVMSFQHFSQKKAAVRHLPV
ncbi:pseudouridine-5'-phosphate glycosidase isoform X1 [Raphanus sativus]|uniref:Pseudouridine-5'-phosphate glycosidase isoform X1 n=1 Tax=Raphanus sativus TaxID=3726 RepID=A0A6J0N7F9_RAPSA|nr:pseudouridine-5'-phosphate glycosidase isoform X1 [Raphanus sativus]XP_056844223.1 pseudouridine-5'-phosphate glycosidase isoform X1 [Raphanus sativus]